MKICDFPFLLFLLKNEKTPETLDFTGLSGEVFGVPEGSRTPDLSLRRRTLYPTELHVHGTQPILIIHYFAYQGKRIKAL